MKKLNPIYGKIITYSIIPLLLVIIGTYAGIYYLSPTLSVDLDQEYQQNLLDQNRQLASSQANNLITVFEGYESKLNLIADKTADLLETKPNTTRQSYFHDVTKDKLTPRPEFSSRYNQTVDFSVSSYFVNNDIPRSNYSSNLNDTIQYTSLLDLSFISIYPTIDDLLWMQVYINDTQVERTYPFIGPRTSTYNPTNTTLYNSSLNVADGIIYDNVPHIDDITNSTVLSFGKNIIIDNQREAFVSFTIEFQHLLDKINEIKELQKRAFLINKNHQVILHTTYTSEEDILNATQHLRNIYELETDEVAFIQHLNLTSSNLNQTVVNYGGSKGTQVVATIDIRGYTFGIAQQLTGSDIDGTFNNNELYVLPILIFLALLLVFVALLRRFGFLRNIDLETIVKFEQTVRSKLSEIQDVDPDTVGEKIRDEIKEEGEELREKTKETLEVEIKEGKEIVENLDTIIETEIEEELDELENQLMKAIDNKIETAEEFVQNAKNTLSLSTNQISRLLQDPEKFVTQQGKVFGLENTSDPEEIAKLPNETTRLAAILLTQDQISIEEFLNILRTDNPDVKRIVDTIPDEYGITLEEDIIHLEKKQIRQNIQHLLQIYYQLTPQEENISSEPDQEQPQDRNGVTNEVIEDKGSKREQEGAGSSKDDNHTGTHSNQQSSESGEKNEESSDEI